MNLNKITPKQVAGKKIKPTSTPLNPVQISEIKDWAENCVIQEEKEKELRLKQEDKESIKNVLIIFLITVTLWGGLFGLIFWKFKQPNQKLYKNWPNATVPRN